MNLFIWQLSATLHSSSSFSVYRSDFRLVHQHHLPKEVMSQVLAGFSDHYHCCISYTYPIFPRRTTDWIVCYRADFAVFMFLGGTIFRLHQQIILIDDFIMMLGWDCVDFGRCVYGGERCAFDSYSSR